MDKIKAEFEAWITRELCSNDKQREQTLRKQMFPDDPSRYKQLWIDAAWQGWQASRKDIEIELPPMFKGITEECRANNKCVLSCASLIRKAGIRIKGDV